jgi:hypothetical protein
MKVCQRKKRKTENEKIKNEVIFEILFPKLEKLINIDIFLYLVPVCQSTI